MINENGNAFDNPDIPACKANYFPTSALSESGMRVKAVAFSQPLEAPRIHMKFSCQSYIQSAILSRDVFFINKTVPESKQKYISFSCKRNGMCLIPVMYDFQGGDEVAHLDLGTIVEYGCACDQAEYLVLDTGG